MNLSGGQARSNPRKTKPSGIGGIRHVFGRRFMANPPSNNFKGTEIERIRKLFKTKAGKILPGIKKMQAKDVREWFTTNMKMLGGNINVNKVMRENPERLIPGSRITSRTLGMMMMWFYDPKWKKKLPYYDRLPVGFIV